MFVTSEVRDILDKDHVEHTVIDEIEEHFDVSRTFIVFLTLNENHLHTETLQNR